MALKQIALNTEPHVAEVGPHRLLFQPEVYGDEFLDAYSHLQEAQKEVSATKLEDTPPEKVAVLYRQMRGFLARLMLPESAAEFDRFEVAAKGKPVRAFRTREAAMSYAEEVGATDRVEDKSIRLPDRVLVELMEWVVQLYAGVGARPTGSSKGSARSSSKAGTRGKAASRSRASIRADGPSVPS